MSQQGPRHGRSRRFWRSRKGSIAPMFALLLVPMIGMLGMAGEGSSWFLTQRAAQYTADQAALAAAANNCAPGASCATGGTTYVQEAAAVSRRYSFVNGANNTTVVADTTGTPSPPCDTSTCYRVTIQRNQPILMLRIVGFNGNATTSTGQAATAVAARAIATRRRSTTEFCVTVLSTDPEAFRINGGPNFDLSSCVIYAPAGGARCNGGSGSNVQAAYVATAGTSNDCGAEHVDPLTLMDPYRAKTSNLPPNPCSSYPGVTIPAGPKSWSQSSPVCGTVTLGGNVTVSGDSVLVIENGNLDLNGKTLTAASGTSLTIIFTGPTTGASSHIITGSGTLDYSAPSSGPWSGIALYQDPRITTGTLDFTYSGSTPTFKITGLVYTPNANLQFSGAINHATGGLACLTFFAKTVLINGTGSIFATPTIDCDRAGLSSSDVQTLRKVVLVQ